MGTNFARTYVVDLYIRRNTGTHLHTGGSEPQTSIKAIVKSWQSREKQRVPIKN